MQQKIVLRLKPEQVSDTGFIHATIAEQLGKRTIDISGFNILKKSLDARSRQIWVNLVVLAFINEPFKETSIQQIKFKQIHPNSKSVVIIGAGPAGLFAALHLLASGIRPIVLERGKDVKNRRRDLALLNKQGIVDPESNYCFGEGGAGTYSDGKLYTRSNKRGNIDAALNIFVQFGAPQEILYEAHPHIGTNKLPQIITAMRQAIIEAGGEFHFEKKVVDFQIRNEKLNSVISADGDIFSADAFILATGHSARDIFLLLHKKNIHIEPKPFALGVRIEHPQELINQIQYHCDSRYLATQMLPAASYSLVEQVDDRGVFSFCMCPGGIIAPASTAPGELVVNGWSPSKRNNPFANSGMVVQVNEKDAFETLGKDAFDPKDPLILMKFQQEIEIRAFNAGGGNMVAPAQRMADFVSAKRSVDLPKSSYIPGLNSTDLQEVLPDQIGQALKIGLKKFGAKMRGYLTNEAVLVATESRTSSPVRIPRHLTDLTHPQLNNLYPCGEGAGYAGGIISAAMDGEKVAASIALKLKS